MSVPATGFIEIKQNIKPFFVSELKVCELQRLQQLPAIVSGPAGGSGGRHVSEAAAESLDSTPSDWLADWLHRVFGVAPSPHSER